MSNKIKQISNFLLYAVLDGGIYGIVIYCIYTWVAGYSLLYAYLVNLAFIVFGLAMDEVTVKYLQSKKLVTQIKEGKDKDIEKNYRPFRWITDSFVSFKTILYVFYVFILIVSQIIEFDPTFLSENLRGFILANNYSILFLIAFDQLIKQFSKDREKMKYISKKLESSISENQD